MNLLLNAQPVAPFEVCGVWMGSINHSNILIAKNYFYNLRTGGGGRQMGIVGIKIYTYH